MTEVLLCLVELFPDQHPITADWLKQSKRRPRLATSDQETKKASQPNLKSSAKEVQNPFQPNLKTSPGKEAEPKSAKGESPEVVPRQPPRTAVPSSVQEFTGTLRSWSATGRTNINRSWDDIINRFNSLSSKLSDFDLKKIIDENLVGFQLMDIADLGTGQRVDVVMHKSTSTGPDKILICLHGSKKTTRYEAVIDDLTTKLIHELLEVEKTHD